MRKTALLSVLSMIVGVFASFENEVPDFTVVDVDGNSHSLYAYLSAGNHVLAKLTASYWHSCIPMVSELNAEYRKYGSNNEGLIVLSVFASESDAEVIAYNLEHGVEYPSISGTAGGGEVSYVTFAPFSGPLDIVLVAPDRSIVERLASGTFIKEELSLMLERYSFGISIHHKPTISTQLKMVNAKYLGSGSVSINLPASGSFDFSIFTLNGKTVFKKKEVILQSGVFILDTGLSNIPSGVYLFNATLYDKAYNSGFIVYWFFLSVTVKLNAL